MIISLCRETHTFGTCVLGPYTRKRVASLGIHCEIVGAEPDVQSLRSRGRMFNPYEVVGWSNLHAVALDYHWLYGPSDMILFPPP